MRHVLLTTFATLLAASAWLPHSARGQQVIEIDASALGGTEARPSDLNNAGQVVGSFVASNGVRHAFIWTDGVMLDIETDPNAQSFALGINDHGVVVGQTTDTDGDTIAFRWSAQTHMVRVTVFDGASIAGRESTALDINNNDVMVGYARAQSPFGLLDRAYRMTGFGPGQQIGGLTAFISRALAINDSAQIVGQADATNFVTVATFWDPFAIQLDTATGSASDINDAGRAVGRASIGSTDRGRLWRLDPSGPPIETALNPLPLPGHTTSAASGIRNEASTNGPLEIVGRSSSSSEFRAVRWLVDALGTPTVEDLNGLLPEGSGWFLRTAAAINDRGQITGTGTLGDSEIRAYLYDPNEPEPDPEPEAEPPAVLFLHGILASNLYTGNGIRVWPPKRASAEFDLGFMALLPGGISALGVAPREQDVVLADPKTVNIYKGFVNFMNELRDAGRVSDWYAFTYDWRFDYDDILDDGAAYRSECVGVFAPTCEECTDQFGAGACVRLDEKILELARPSPDVQRKVWVVAHSNGGLLFKTLLLRMPELRDQLEGLILVGSPQLGTPQTLPPSLHGEEYDLLAWIGKKDNIQRLTRTSARTWPMSYLLLPSRAFFPSVRTPALTFDPNNDLGIRNPNIALWNSQYPFDISSFADMEDFLLGNRRARFPPSNVDMPEVLDPQLFSDADVAHMNIDAFDPGGFLEPLPVYQIVGWGLETTRGVGYEPTEKGAVGHKKLHTCDGDGTVVVPSAQAISNATTYYINFPAYNSGRTKNRRHKNMLEPEPVQELIAAIIEGEDTTGIDHISPTMPTQDCDGFRLRTRSPAEIHVFQDGLHTGPAEEEDPNSTTILIDDEIPNSRYTTLGKGREAIVDGVGIYDVVVKATGVGTVTLEAERFIGDEDVERLYVPLIPILKGSTISFLLDPNSDVPPELMMDIDGDGTPDLLLPTDGTIPDPELYLDVLISAVEQLSADTRDAELKRSTRFVLRYFFLRHTLRLLEKAESDLVRKPRRAERRLKLARGTLRLYTLLLEHAVRNGRASEEAAQPLLEQADAIRELIATLIEQLP